MNDKTVKTQLSSKELDTTNDQKPQKHIKIKEKYECNECKFRASLKRDLKKHKEELHPKVVERIQCEECGYIGRQARFF